MVVDFIVGLLGTLLGVLFGFGWHSALIFPFAFILDADIIVNELYRIFIKKEKKFGLDNFLDEYSYTHKFWFHLPLIVVPVVFIAGLIYLNWIFGLLISAMVIFHLIHDTVHKTNYDGVCWLYPFSFNSYRFFNGRWEKRTRKELREEAERTAKNFSGTKKILKNNIF